MPGRTSMVFTRTCEETRFLSLVLRNLGLKAIPISGQMSQEKRFGALNKFKAGECNILVCTNVASRGLDIPTVDMIINYIIPDNPKDYILRVGRTARAGRFGITISLVNIFDYVAYKNIEKLIGKTLPAILGEEEEIAEVMFFKARVEKSRNISLKKIREDDGNKRKWRRDGDEGGDEGFNFGAEMKNAKGWKKPKRR